MEYWIMTLILMRVKLKALTEALDKRINSIAINPGGKTEDIFNELMFLVNKKSKLINLKILFDELVSNLNFEEKVMIRELAKFKTYGFIAEKLKVSKATVARLKKKFLIKAEKILNKIGYSEDVFKKEYGSFKIINDTYFKIKRFLSAKKESGRKPG